jgi:alpha-L-fucosidase
VEAVSKGAFTTNRKSYLQTINDVVKNGIYRDTWESLFQYEVPKWYQDAKFGIFIHWGVYSVPAFGSEWYPHDMYVKGSPQYEHHLKTYGSHKKFGYRDFIPMFHGESFDPDAWAELFRRSGAKYVIPVSEHHDGFQMYRSELSHYNSYEMGPHRDVAGEMKKALESRGLIYGASSHRIEHWFYFGHGKEFDSDVREPLTPSDLYWPAMPEPDHLDLFSPAPSREFLEDWLLRTCEIVDRYHPKVMYFDWWIQHSAVKPYLKKFAAYYYNRAREWGEEVAINYKQDGMMFGSGVVDMERGQFAEAKPYFWQTDTSVADNSWGYTTDNKYKTASEILCTLADTVSKNGCLLLNIGPRADGTIPEKEQEILREIGDWMETNGEAIYGCRVWRKAEEGPTKTVEGQFMEGEMKPFTSRDIRFTVNGSSVYAIFLKCPDNGVFHIESLGERDAMKLPHFHGIIRDVSVLGFPGKPTWKRTGQELTVEAPSVRSDKPVVLKVLVD